MARVWFPAEKDTQLASVDRGENDELQDTLQDISNTQLATIQTWEEDVCHNYYKLLLTKLLCWHNQNTGEFELLIINND